MTKKLLFVYPNLQIGGIECWLMKQITNAVKNGYQVLWISNGYGRVFSGWSDFAANNIKKTNVFNILKELKKDDEIIGLCFRFVDYGYLLDLRKRLKGKSFNLFYCVPHFKDPVYFPEEFGFLSKLFIKYYKYVYETCDRLGNLLFFSSAHIESVQKRYGIVIKDRELKLIPVSGNLSSHGNFDVEMAQKRAVRNNFTIITCGRFDFPHKGYMIGLIRIFAELKEKYKDIKLIIIGYGPGKKQLETEVGKLNDETKRDIIFTGGVDPDRLIEYFNKSHLNISVAGAVRAGAITGLVSIPARHYCYDCEVYGYLPDSIGYTTSEQPGIGAKEVIENVIKMSDADYINLCKKSFFSFWSKESDDKFIFCKVNNYDSQSERKIISICRKVFLYQELNLFPKRIAGLFNFFRRQKC